ncbi:threonine synthase [Marinicauda algicola]|uniref:Threonine synthase n=1 Tax=Marinicauda algicola TaxID=2029849 RepID=A0A4S2H1B8_9PROT|nr:threonine synthase [Marinicauda algicola]TGY89340.1 threonine synthase [Marinicauda algicola]
MKFVSTRGGCSPASLSDAIRAGQAPDGGLYMPERMPEDPLGGLAGEAGLVNVAERLLAPFFAGDRLEAELADLCSQAYDFDVPLSRPDPARGGLHVLELFHGPTGAFKDFGARFLMACLDLLAEPGAPLTVLAATSGDTGGAAGGAAQGRPGVRAVILFAKDRVSPFQRHQLTCWDEPVAALEIEGDFDACQALVKQAFADRALSQRHRLTSANSINLARLLPQSAYLAWAARRVFAETGMAPGLILPTGNLGHGVAALFARAMGAPLGPLILATNANATLSDWMATGAYRPRASVQTLANAMDVGAPSNFERLTRFAPHGRQVRVERVDDDAIRARIRADFERFGQVWCPHSATAAEAHARLSPRERETRPWILAATAHPFKFAETVEPLIGRAVEPSPALAAIADRTSRAFTCPADLDALAGYLDTLTETV